jgi:hypothetical protein
MPSEAKKYFGYARECVRLAGHAETTEARSKLIDLARVWMQAGLNEEGNANPSPTEVAAGDETLG